MEAYTLDDAHSFEGAATDEEEEERAVQEFVSDIDMHDGNVKLRQPNSQNADAEDSDDDDKKNEDEEASQQFSIDDVTDDEEGD